MILHVSEHAKQRAQLRLNTIWTAECPGGRPDLQAWLLRRFSAAMRGVAGIQNMRSVNHRGVTFRIAIRGDVATLCTVTIDESTCRRGRKNIGQRPRRCRVCGGTAGVCDCPEL